MRAAPELAKIREYASRQRGTAGFSDEGLQQVLGMGAGAASGIECFGSGWVCAF
jgi:hypothetical protein